MQLKNVLWEIPLIFGVFLTDRKVLDSHFNQTVVFILEISPRQISVEVDYWKNCGFQFREVLRKDFVIEHIFRKDEVVTLQEWTPS